MLNNGMTDTWVLGPCAGQTTLASVARNTHTSITRWQRRNAMVIWSVFGIVFAGALISCSQLDLLGYLPRLRGTGTPKAAASAEVREFYVSKINGLVDERREDLIADVIDESGLDCPDPGSYRIRPSLQAQSPLDHWHTHIEMPSH
jgi:hypothetical protein